MIDDSTVLHNDDELRTYTKTLAVFNTAVDNWLVGFNRVLDEVNK
jgi:hypothetical protein